MKIIFRLKEYIDFKGLSLNAFDKSIGASNGYIGKQIKNEASIGVETIQKIISAYNDIDLSWLITGEGQMIKNNEPIIENKSQTDCYLLIEKIKSLEKELLLKNEQIDSHRDHIETLKKQLTDCNNDKKFLQTSVFTQKNIKV